MGYISTIKAPTFVRRANELASMVTNESDGVSEALVALNNLLPASIDLSQNNDGLVFAVDGKETLSVPFKDDQVSLSFGVRLLEALEMDLIHTVGDDSPARQ